MSEGPWCNWCDKEKPSWKHLEKHHRESDVTFTAEGLAEHDRQVAERAWGEAIEHVDKILGGEYSAGIRLHQPYRKGQS